jgi:hypothetical protein
VIVLLVVAVAPAVVVVVCGVPWRRLLTAEPWAHSLVTSCEIRDGRNGTGADISSSLFGFPLLIHIPPLLCSHLSPPLELCNSRITCHMITF